MFYAVVILVALALFVLWLRWSEPRLLYYPTRQIEATPQELGLAHEEVRLVATDGVRLHGWFLPCPAPTGGASAGSAAGTRTAPPTARVDAAQPRGGASPAPPLTVLFLHGNAGNISHRFDKVALLHELGADVLLFDYRGYGLSGGRPSEQGTYRDGRAAYDYLVQERGLDPRRIVLFGESLGSAVAVELASRLPVGGVVLEEAFTSVPDAAQHLYPFIPVGWIVRNRYDTLSRIGRVEAPLLLLHSRDDEYFPLAQARRLLAAAHAPRRLVELRGGHNEAFMVSGATYRRALGEFLAGLAANARPAPPDTAPRD
jgi:pimeloyl-ACP methyl ester carboxylesterase